MTQATPSALDHQRPEAHAPSAMSTASRVPLAQVYNEMHGLIVQVGKHYCRKQNPNCDACPLGSMLAKPVQSGSSLPAKRQPTSAN